ncbi:MAG TPA: hypothetical protein VFQ91_25855 [Bryobacteraceae bacterium]|nr:hypothetical protein [Bryobacteraceae bacterium]
MATTGIAHSTEPANEPIPPTPSRYYEVGRLLIIPMVPPARGSKLWHERYILHFANISHWTSPPDLPLTPPELRAIADRIVRYQQVGVRGL